MTEERVQKLIARSGLCSRREAEVLIGDGRVTINGHRARLGDRADPEHDHIKVDGKPLRAARPRSYLLLYKPREVITSCDDPQQRRTVIDLIRPTVRERLFPVGRLDYHSEGLLILTNDGELAARITHPRYGVVREYLVKIKGELSDAEMHKLLRGTTIDGHPVKPLSVRRSSRTRSGNSWWRIEVAEGRTHEVRELFFRVGHHVQRLKRTAIGPVRDRTLKPGEFRPLTDRELAALRKAGTGKSRRNDQAAREPRTPQGKTAARRTGRRSG